MPLEYTPAAPRFQAGKQSVQPEHKPDRPLTPRQAQAKRVNQLLTAAAKDRRLTRTHVAVLSVMTLDYLHHKPGPKFDLIWPRVAELAEQLAVARRTVFRAINQLLELGYLIAERRGGGRNLTNVCRPGNPVNGDIRDTVNGPVNGDIRDTKRCHSHPETVTRMSPDLTEDPTENLSYFSQKKIRSDVARLSKTVKPEHADAAGSRSSRIAQDWSPSSESIALSKKLGIKPDELDYATGKFRNHWLGASGSYAASPDWDARFSATLYEVAQNKQRTAGTGSRSRGGYIPMIIGHG